MWHIIAYFTSLQVISEIIESCRAHDYTDIILVHEHRGVPDGLIISHLPFGPTAYFGLLNVVSILFIVVSFWAYDLAYLFGWKYINEVLNCRLLDMTSRTRKQLEQCQRLTRI